MINPHQIFDKVYFKNIKSINFKNDVKIIRNNSISFDLVNDIQCFNDENYLLNIVLIFDKKDNSDKTLIDSFNILI